MWALKILDRRFLLSDCLMRNENHNEIRLKMSYKKGKIQIKGSGSACQGTRERDQAGSQGFETLVQSVKLIILFIAI